MCGEIPFMFDIQIKLRLKGSIMKIVMRFLNDFIKN
jgi:hypothetical protein